MPLRHYAMLLCNADGHNKFYEMELVQVGERHYLRRRWGRNHVRGVQGGGQTRSEEANYGLLKMEFDKLIAQKQRKGYVVEAEGFPDSAYSMITGDRFDGVPTKVAVASAKFVIDEAGLSQRRANALFG